jgi:hypothetical protein
MVRYRTVTSVAPKSCASGAGNDIIVCARATNRNPRLPYPEERNEPGERVRLGPGEVPSAMGAFRVPCPPRGCAGDGSLSKGIAKVMERIRD